MLTEQFWISALINFIILSFVIGLDIYLRHIIKSSPELFSFEIVIFSAAHSLYQLITYYLFENKVDVNSGIPQEFIWIKLIIFLLLFIIIYDLYRQSRELLIIRINEHFTHLSQKNLTQANKLANLKKTIQENISIDLWNLQKRNRKKIERESFNELILNIGVDPSDTNTNDLLIPKESRDKFKIYILILTAFCVILAFLPSYLYTNH